LRDHDAILVGFQILFCNSPKNENFL